MSGSNFAPLGSKGCRWEPFWGFLGSILHPWGPKGAAGSHFGGLGGALGGPRGAFGGHFGGLGVPLGAFGAQSAPRTPSLD